MMNKNLLLLLSNNDIPFIEAQITIHNPTIKEISLIGEEAFHSGCQLILLSKNSLNAEDKSVLEDKSDFEILMAIMCSKEYIKFKNQVLCVLSLLFPNYTIKFTEKDILLASTDNATRINETNFEEFKEIISAMFDLEKGGSSSDYNPISKRAEKIAEKLRKAKEKKNKDTSINTLDIYGKYASILSIGLSVSLNVIMDYTPYQLMDQLVRFQKREAYDMHIKAQMAGATGLDEVDNWMENIHS